MLSHSQDLRSGFLLLHLEKSAKIHKYKNKTERCKNKNKNKILVFLIFADLNADYLDMGFSRSSLGGGSSRTKRMRTSFKHHQLRTMKSYFAINHNPDAKDLKQLSQKTGLPKRVLQVRQDESNCSFIIHSLRCVVVFWLRVFNSCILFLFFFAFVRFGSRMHEQNGGEWWWNKKANPLTVTRGRAASI